MEELKTGEYYGAHYKKLSLNNMVITDTEYTHNKVDWHYHENPYFTYLLQGKLYESNKNKSYFLKPGSLLYHNWQDAHHNIKPPEYTRGFHIELNKDWFLKNEIISSDIEGSIDIRCPIIKDLMNKVFIESKINDQYSDLSVESLMIEIFSNIKNKINNSPSTPPWVERIQELIYEEDINYSLTHLSNLLDIHPIHLSREFSRYFGTNLGNYIRLIKLNKAFHLIISRKLSFSEVSYHCGFYDQSHFIRNFKQVYHKTPKQLLKEIS